MHIETRLGELEARTETVDVRSGELAGKLSLPRGEDPVPGVLVLGGSGGGVPEYELRLLAAHGFAAFGLRYFGGDGRPTSLLHIPLEYGGDAIAWLQRHPRCQAAGVGVVGYSRGGELALLLGSTYSDVHAVVSFVGSNVAWGSVIKRFADRWTHPRFWVPGAGRAWHTARRAAWTRHGQPVPFVQPSMATYVRIARATVRRGLTQTQRHGPLLEDTPAIEHAAIPVEQINGPVLLFSGEQDEEWPSSVMSRMVMDRLAAHRHPFPDEHISYPDAGHAFPADRYREAWERTITFLHRHLDSQVRDGA